MMTRRTTVDRPRFVPQAILHVLFWSIYLAAEFLANMYHYPDGAYGRLLRDTLTTLPILVAATYFITNFLIPRYLVNQKGWLFTGFVLLTAIAVFWGRVYWLSLINYFDTDRFFHFPPSKVLKNVIRDYSIIALAVCLNIIDDWRRKDRLNEDLQREKAETELQLLRAQLQPHFLFNTLNNLYGLALQRSEQAAEGILKLSEILDYLLYFSGKEKVPLSREINLLNNYIDLEKLRHGAQLKITTDFSGMPGDQQVAPLIFLPFLENCFKHGGKDEKGRFWIKACLRTYDDRLVFTLENSKKKNGNSNSIASGGIGLRNIRRRLDILYPGRHELIIEDRELYFGIRLELEPGHAQNTPSGKSIRWYNFEF